jgi:hypothetical protein
MRRPQVLLGGDTSGAAAQLGWQARGDPRSAKSDKR